MFSQSVPSGSWVTRQGDRRDTHRGLPPSELKEGEREGWGWRDSWQGTVLRLLFCEEGRRSIPEAGCTLVPIIHFSWTLWRFNLIYGGNWSTE